MDPDPNAPKTYRRPSDIVAPTPMTTNTATTAVAADPDAPATYKRPGGGQPVAAQPDPNAYKPPDWIPGAGFLYKTNRVLENAFLPGADYLTAKAGDLARSIGIKNTTPSTAQLRAETKQDRTDIGPVASAIADTAGYAMGPGRVLGPLAGRFAPVAGRYGAAAAEGAAANAVDAFGNQLGSDKPLNYWDTGKHIVAGGLTGVGGQAIGDVTAPLVRRVMDYTHGLPGRSGENLWDWRTRTAAGEDVRPDIENWRQSIPPASLTPERNAAIDKTIGALSQSTEPGPVAHLTTAAATGAAGKFGLTPYLDQISHLAELSGPVAGGVSWLGGNPVARGVNTIDRNINVGQSFDQLYPTLTGRQSTTDVSDWANALRRLGIGSQAQP